MGISLGGEHVKVDKYLDVWMGTDEWISVVVPTLCGKMGTVRASGFVCLCGLYGLAHTRPIVSTIVLGIDQ